MSDAITRKESLLKSIADGTSSSLKPITREEQYLAYIAGESNSFPTTPITREEAFLDKIAKRGAGGGGSSINVQPLTVTENGTWDAPEGQAYDPVIVDVKPITEPITITENGVYPVPKVSGGALDYGKEATFKNKITVEEITNYLDGVGFEIQTDATQSMLMYTLENGTLMIGWSNGVLIPQEAGYHIMVVPNEVEITGTGYTYLAGFPSYPDGGWYAINTIAGKIIPWATPITVAFTTPDPDRPYMATPNFELLSVFFDIETKSLDGWGDITVNVAGGGGAELNIAYGDTAPEDTSKLWVKTTQPSAVKVSSELDMQVGGNASVTAISATVPLENWSTYVGCAVGDKAYAFGGRTADYISKCFRLDMKQETTSMLSATLPGQVRWGMTAVAVEEKIYLIGGYVDSSNNTNTIIYYDTLSQTFTTLGVQFPTNVGSAAGAYYDGKIYVLGGNRNSGRSNAITCWDIDNETFTELSAVLPQPISAMAFAQNKEVVYLFGGLSSSNRINTIYKFNCETETITTIGATLPVAAANITASVLGDKIFLFGGYTDYYAELDSICCFETMSETLTMLNTTLPTKSYHIAATAYEEEIYVFGGNLGKTIYTFSPDLYLQLTEGELQIQSADDGNKFNLINTDVAQVEIGVVKAYKGNAEGIGEMVEASLHNGTSWVTI